MKKIRAAVLGYGNIGKYVCEALEAAPDFEIAGIVRRNAQDIPQEIAQHKVVKDISELDAVDVAISIFVEQGAKLYESSLELVSK